MSNIFNKLQSILSSITLISDINDINDPMMFSSAISQYKNGHALYRLDNNMFKYALIKPRQRKTKVKRNILPYLVDSILPSFKGLPARLKSNMFMSSPDEFAHPFGLHKYVCLVENNAKLAYIEKDFNTFRMPDGTIAVRDIYYLTRFLANCYTPEIMYESFVNNTTYDDEFISVMIKIISDNLHNESMQAEAKEVFSRTHYKEFLNDALNMGLIPAYDKYLQPLRQAIQTVTTDKINTIPPGCEVWTENQFIAINIDKPKEYSWDTD